MIKCWWLIMFLWGSGDNAGTNEIVMIPYPASDECATAAVKLEAKYEHWSMRSDNALAICVEGYK